MPLTAEQALEGRWVEEDRGYETPCRIWQRGVTKDGYAEACVRRRVVYAHRVAYEMANGPIPPGHSVHHRCEVGRCVNPEHMTVLSRRDHAGAGGHGKLTIHDAREIRSRCGDGESQRAVAVAFGVSQRLVGFIVRGEKWKDA